MYNKIILVIVFAAAFLVFKKTTVKQNAKKFNIGMATEYDKLEKQREAIMFGHPITGELPKNIREQELLFYKNYLANTNKATRGNTGEWYSAGPWNVGGRTRAMALDATNEAVIIAGSVSGAIYRSTDTGLSWTRVSNIDAYQGIVSISQDKRPGKQNIWYACSGEASGNSASGGGAYYFGDGLLKSIDSGKSWQPITSTTGGLPNSFTQQYQVAWRIASHPATDSDYVFLATYGSILKSNNGGNTFVQVLGDFAGSSPYYTDVTITTTGIIYATLSSDGNGKGFYRSDDKGLSWVNITPINFDTYERTVMGINPNNENEVYFFTYLPDSTNTYGTKTSNYKGTAEWISLLKYTYISGNGTGTGGSWVNLSNNLPNNANMASAGSFDKLNCQGGYDMFVVVQPNTNNVFIGGTNIFRSTDAFTTPNNFVQIGGYKPLTALPFFQIYPNHHPDCHDLLFSPSNPAKIISASDGGVHISFDGNATTPVVWQNRNHGYISSQLYSVTLEPDAGGTWLLGGFQDNGNFISTNFNNPQQTWTLPFNGDGAFNYIAPNRDFVVMSIQEGKMAKFKLDNTGAVTNFMRIDPIGPTADDYLFINKLAVDPNDNNLLYFPAGKYLYRQNQLTTLPLAGTWDSISTGWFKLPDSITTPNTSNGFAAQISAIAVSKNPANLVYIGTTNRDVYRIENANTATPIVTKINKNFMAGYVSGIAVDPDDGNKVMVCYSNYFSNNIFYSTSKGDTFLYASGNLRKTNSNYSGYSPSVRDVAIVKMHDGSKKYFACTSVGLYSTTLIKGGATISKDSTTWAQESPTTIGTAVVNHITHRADGMVAISTHGSGAFYSQQAWPTTIDKQIKKDVNNFTINAYPNPMFYSGTISIEANTTDKYFIYVTDLLGKRIYNQPQVNLSGGKHSFALNVNNIPTGTYLIVVQNSNGQKQVKQVWIN
jgi:hypothetical protein